MQAVQPIPKSNLREDILENLGTPHEIAFFYGNFGKNFVFRYSQPENVVPFANENFRKLKISGRMESPHCSSAQRRVWSLSSQKSCRLPTFVK